MSENSTTVRVVPCPSCRTPVRWATDNPWRPFCSERCKLIDLGQWASDGYVIPGDAPDPEDPAGTPPAKPPPRD